MKAYRRPFLQPAILLIALLYCIPSIAGELPEGFVVTVFPDAGYKYLSDQKLWGGE